MTAAPSDSPAVSVVILTRDRPDEFSRLLRAMTFQRFRDFEVIVVGAEASAEAHGAPPALARRLAYIRCAPRNISLSRNFGVAHARGGIVAFIDDDAIPEPDWLARLIPAFDAPDVGAAGGFVRARNGVAFQWRGAMVDRFGGHRPAAPAEREDGDAFLSTVGCNGAFRRCALEAVGGFDENFRYFLDESDLCLRLREAGWRTALAPEAEVHHAYSASAERFANRAPRDLYEIGASRVYFGRRHGDPAAFDAALARFRAEQADRLRKYVQLGRLSRKQAGAILRRMEEGIADGEARAAAAGGRAWPRGPARPAPPVRAADGPFVEAAPARRPRIAIVAGRFARLAARRAAERLSAAGAEKTLIDFRLGAARLSVRFDGSVWAHGGGVLGREDFDGPSRSPRRHARAARELARVAARRDFDVVIRPDGEAYRIGALRPARLGGLLAGYVAEPLRIGGEAAATALFGAPERLARAGAGG